MKKLIGYYRKCDLLTMFSTLVSFLGIMLAIEHHYSLPVICLLISGICDAFDGTLARKFKYNKSQQAYGVELDSLSDVICFGVLPAVLTSVMADAWYVNVICGFYLLCGVVRLAYFNTLKQTDESKNGKFVGVPITTVAIVYPVVFLIIKIIDYTLLSKVMPVVLLILGISYILRIEIPKPNVLKILNKVFNKYVVNLVIFPIFLVGVADFFYKLNYNNLYNSIFAVMNTLKAHFIPFIFICLCVGFIFLLINSIVKKSKITKIIMLVFFLLILIINDIKFNIMGIPLELSDVNYLNPDNMQMMGTATSSIGSWIYITMLKSFILVVLGVLLVFFDKKLPLNFETKKIRIISLSISTGFVACFIIANFVLNNCVLKFVYGSTPEEILNFNSVGELYTEYGFFQGIYINSLYENDSVPEGYSSDLVKDIMNIENDLDEKKWDKANVVFILSESFSNLENISEIKFSESLTPNIDRYETEKDKLVMDLLVPSYGGVSVNTEFEILTGASLSFWKSGYIAYNQYYNDVSGKYAPNIIKEFNNNGYETIYLTPWGRNSYKSEYVYSLLGADKTIYGDQLSGETKGLYYSDKSLMEDIYNELKDTSNGNYKFIMAATGQNHFPFDQDVYSSFDVSIFESSLSEEDNKILKNYAQGLYDADKELNNLYNMIQDLDVPTIIVFYGDHLPYTANSSGVDPYTSSSYFNTADYYLNVFRTYTTKAVMLANYDIKFDDIDYLNANYLGAYVLNKMDLDISNYFKYVDYARTIVPVFNRNLFYQDGNVISLEQASENIKNTLNNYKYVQYGIFYDFNR